MSSNLSQAGNGTDVPLADQVGGIAFLLAHLASYLPYTVLYSMAAVFGVLGNFLIIATIVLNKELHNSTNMLVFNLSLGKYLFPIICFRSF